MNKIEISWNFCTFSSLNRMNTSRINSLLSIRKTSKQKKTKYRSKFLMVLFFLLINVWHRSARRRAIVEIKFGAFDARPDLTRERIISLTCSIDLDSFNFMRRSNNDSKQALRTFRFSSFDKTTNNGKTKLFVFVELKAFQRCLIEQD